MEKFVKGLIVVALCLVVSTSVSLAEERGLGDLGKPDDYDQTAVKWDTVMPGVDNLVAGLSHAFNWWDQGKVTPAKDQGGCGSCWAFATIGVLESRIRMKLGKEIDLSEQLLISCCKNGGGGCCGGSMAALNFFEGNGPLEESCTKYADKTTSCNPGNCDKPDAQCPAGGTKMPCDKLPTCTKLPYRLGGYYTVDMSKPDDVKTTIFVNGPAYFRFDVYEDFMTFWREGLMGTVYSQKEGKRLGGHAVLVIGWDDKKKAWLCKNSWGPKGPNKNGTFWIAYSGHAIDLKFGVGNVTTLTQTGN